MVWQELTPEELVQRLSQAVLTQIHPWLLEKEAAALNRPIDPDSDDINTLRRDLDLMLLREEKLRQQIQNYEDEISQLTAENQELQHLVQELPEIYRHKFMARLAPIQARIRQIQEENYLLKSELMALNTTRPWALPGWSPRALPYRDPRTLPAQYDSE
ncbi:MAG: hypothetical protein OHK0012_26160 [Synechococcales cyanobacterium]